MFKTSSHSNNQYPCVPQGEWLQTVITPPLLPPETTLVLIHCSHRKARTLIFLHTAASAHHGLHNGSKTEPVFIFSRHTLFQNIPPHPRDYLVRQIPPHPADDQYLSRSDGRSPCREPGGLWSWLGRKAPGLEC